MLHTGRLEIRWKGPFEVRFRCEDCESWTTRKRRFYEAEGIIMFLIDSLSLSPQDASKLVLNALANGRSVSQKVVCSDQQLQSIFGPGLYVTSTRRAS